MEKLTYTVDELAQALSIGRNQAYNLCHEQGFPSIRIGKRLIIPVDSLREWLKEQGTEQRNA